MKTPRIVVVVEGGVIQQILSDGAPVEVVTVDYDTEGASPEEYGSLDGEDCFLWRWIADGSDPAFVGRAFAATEPRM